MTVGGLGRGFTDMEKTRTRARVSKILGVMLTITMMAESTDVIIGGQEGLTQGIMGRPMKV